MGDSMDSAGQLIEQLGLAPHPEGGWYRETWRGPAGPDGRAGGTAILFLPRAGEASHWHTVDAAELWLWQAGDPIELRLAASDHGPVRALILGSNVGAGQHLQGLVAPGEWQRRGPPRGWVAQACMATASSPAWWCRGSFMQASGSPRRTWPRLPHPAHVRPAGDHLAGAVGGRVPAAAPRAQRLSAAEAILALLADRAAGATIRPSEAARRLAGPQGDWRAEMEAVHAAADTLVAAGAITLSWRGVPMQKRRGPYRIARR
jgi:predicted cupin superfamily sugar epimerase